MRLFPVNNKVLVQRDSAVEKTGSIIIPDTAKKDTTTGTVVALPCDLYDGGLTGVRLAIGDRVLFGKYAGNDIELDNISYVLLAVDELFGILVDDRADILLKSYKKWRL